MKREARKKRIYFYIQYKTMWSLQKCKMKKKTSKKTLSTMTEMIGKLNFETFHCSQYFLHISTRFMGGRNKGEGNWSELHECMRIEIRISWRRKQQICKWFFFYIGVTLMLHFSLSNSVLSVCFIQLNWNGVFLYREIVFEIGMSRVAHGAIISI